MSPTGIIFDVKHFSLHDGPGIRTTVFLKGCPLHCVWCHNPESINPQIEEVNGIPVGRDIGVEELLDELLADRPFYESSGGGVTLSGGEPLMQPAFALALLDALGKAGVHRAIDTCGAVPGDVVDKVARNADLILYDIKATDAQKLRRWTGGQLELILDNLARLDRVGTPIRLRCPLIPGINDDELHLEQIGHLAEQNSCVEAVDLMPYHRFGFGKFGAPSPKELAGVTAPDAARMDDWISQIRKKTGKPVYRG